MRLSAPGGKVKSNVLLIGPYGCGKSELGRAICADSRVIGASISVTSTLTAYMHESVNNVKRVYDAAKELRVNSLERKPVILVLDEFDGWFARSEIGTFSDIDMQQIENTFLEILDGMEDYTGLITLAMTNKPKAVPTGIMRRFRYVDIVGQLNADERASLLKMYLEKSLPTHQDVAGQYDHWAEKLVDTPGDVIRKVVDEIHFSLVPEYIRTHPKEAARVEKILQKRASDKGTHDDGDIDWLKAKLGQYRLITPLDVERTIDDLLKKPNIRKQVNAAKEVYRDAQLLMEELAQETQVGFGLKRKSGIMDS